MKKIVLLLLIVSLLALVACRGDDQTPTGTTVSGGDFADPSATTNGTETDPTEDNSWESIIDTYVPDDGTTDPDETDPSGGQAGETTDPAVDDPTDPSDPSGGDSEGNGSEGIDLPEIPG